MKQTTLLPEHGQAAGVPGLADLRALVNDRRTVRPFYGRPRTALSVVQRTVRDNDRVWGRELVDAAAAIVLAGDNEKLAGEILARVRERRQDAVLRIADELRAAVAGKAPACRDCDGTGETTDDEWDGDDRIDETRTATCVTCKGSGER